MKTPSLPKTFQLLQQPLPCRITLPLRSFCTPLVPGLSRYTQFSTTKKQQELHDEAKAGFQLALGITSELCFIKRYDPLWQKVSEQQQQTLQSSFTSIILTMVKKKSPAICQAIHYIGE